MDILDKFISIASNKKDVKKNKKFALELRDNFEKDSKKVEKFVKEGKNDKATDLTRDIFIELAKHSKLFSIIGYQYAEDKELDKLAELATWSLGALDSMTAASIELLKEKK